MAANKGKTKDIEKLKSKASMELFKTQLAVMRIYKKTYKTKKEILGRFSKEIAEEIGKKFKTILDEEKPSIEEVIKLKELFGFDKNKILSGLNLNKEIDRAERQKIEEMIDQYSSMEEMIGRKMKECFKNDKRGSINKTTIFLSKDKDLYIEPKERHCYPMRSEQLFNILMLLNSEYQLTEDICFKVGSKNNESLRKAIGKLNAQIKSGLGLTANLIQSKQPLGYKINERYELIKE